MMPLLTVRNKGGVRGRDQQERLGAPHHAVQVLIRVLVH